jgi:hypothetical protein
MANDTKQTDEIGTPPDTAAAFAAKANDLEALRAAVVDAASVGAALWFSYILVLLYLFIAVGSVTHRDLLFENPVKLPFLNVDLPLTGFFWLGPALFLTVHAYVLRDDKGNASDADQLPVSPSLPRGDAQLGHACRGSAQAYPLSGWRRVLRSCCPHLAPCAARSRSAPAIEFKGAPALHNNARTDEVSVAQLY